MNALELRNLSVDINGAPLLKDVTLDLAVGRWYTVIGPNGAGKTTLVETVAGARTPTSGTVHVEGRDVHQLRERDRARMIALVPQYPIVPAGTTVWDYVVLGRTAHHGLLRGASAQDDAVVDEVITRVGLDAFARRDIATLSGGERQRAVWARALAQCTRVVVLDEPTTGLDVRHQMEMLELLRREVDDCGLTVLATLHDLTLAGQFADELILLDDGRVRAHGPAADIVRSPELSAAYRTDLRVVDVEGADVVVPVVAHGATSLSGRTN